MRDVTPEDDESGRPLQISIRLGAVDYRRGVDQWLDALAYVQSDVEVATLEKLVKQLA